MLKSVFLFVAVSATSIAYAAASEQSPISQSSMQMPETGSKNDGYASKGVRVGAFKPMLTTQVSSEQNGKLQTKSGESTGDSVGVSIGYVSMPIHRIGWETALSGFSMRDAASTDYNLRAVGNIAVALSSGIYFKSGINLSDKTGKVTLPTGSANVKPGIGYQMGTGYQFSQNFGLDASYVWLSQKHDLAGELFQQGVELALTGTF